MIERIDYDSDDEYRQALYNQQEKEEEWQALEEAQQIEAEKVSRVELPVIWQSRNKIDLYRKDFYYTDDFEIGFWVTDGEHYQLFCEKIYAPRSFEVEVLGRPSHKNDAWYKHFNRAICYKTRELILMYEAWQEKAKYITEVWTKATGGYDVKHYPKPDKWWTVSKLPALSK